MNTVEKKLADLIRDHPNLYDQSRRDYKDNLKGHLSWTEIADGMGKSEEEVKLKWKNLRDKFCKAKKRAANKRSGPPPPPAAADDEGPAERPVPALLGQLAWLGAHVKPRPGSGPAETDEGTGSGDDLEKDRDKDEKEQHGTLPVVSTSFSLVESRPNNHQELGVSLKRKRQATTETEINSADALTNLRDEDELFLLSLLPSLKRLTIKKRMEEVDQTHLEQFPPSHCLRLCILDQSLILFWTTLLSSEKLQKSGSALYFLLPEAVLLSSDCDQT